MENISLSFGRFLKSVRLEKGMSLEEVSRHTKIGRDVLFSLENEDFAKLPDDVYVKGFLRSCADVVGVDREQLVHRYVKDFEEYRQALDRESNRLKKTVRIKKALVAAFFAAACFAGFSVLKEAGSLNDAREGLIAGRDTVNVQAAASPVETPEKKTARVPEPTPPVTLKLRISALAETWVKVIKDIDKPAEYAMKNGDVLTLEAVKGFNLLIGDASSVTLDYNGKKISVPGKSGQIVTLELP